jgi:hypothetical protein
MRVIIGTPFGRDCLTGTIISQIAPNGNSEHQLERRKMTVAASLVQFVDRTGEIVDQRAGSLAVTETVADGADPGLGFPFGGLEVGDGRFLAGTGVGDDVVTTAAALGAEELEAVYE